MHYEKRINACGKRTVLSDGLGQLLTMILQLGKEHNQENHHRSSGLMADVKQENNVYKQ
jgi:hypothetical protein